MPFKETGLKEVRLHRIYINQASRGKGIGLLLLKWLENKIAPEFQSIWLEVMDTENKALPFYLRNGFIEVGRTQLTAERVVAEYKGMLVLAKQMDRQTD